MILCYVTDRRTLPPRLPAGTESFASRATFAGLLANIAAASSAGIDWIQIREKDLAGGDCATLTRAALQASSGGGTRLLVNDRLDIALTELAGGVHVAENSLPVSESRRLINAYRGNLPSQFLVGVSCHSLASALAAAESGADYLIFGPIFPTPSKAAFGPALGLLQLSHVCRAVKIPVLAIGGITLQNAKTCVDSGAAGIAAIRLFQETSELPVVIERLRSLR